MRLHLSAIFFCALLLSGCHDSKSRAAANDTKQYHVRGVVVSTDAAKGEVTLDSEAISGVMDAMTMPYTLKTPNVIGELHPGDTITATLLAAKDSDLLDQIVIVAQAQADYRPPVAYKPLNPGDVIPDFTLLNQSGKLIDLARFHGKTLFMTFIYTRCPLADYCPRMSRNFARLDQMLASSPELYAKTHLLSVSFDPAYDTPKVLRSYGGAYTGNYTNENFAHWDFAAPPQKELGKVLNFFLVGITPEKDKTVTHSLSTIVITPDGKVYKWYPDNDWTPDQLLADVKEILKQRGSEHS